MEETRILLEAHKKSQKIRQQQQAIQKHLTKLNKFAGENHHLLGTATNPGIYSKIPIQNEQISDGFILLDENRLKKNPIFDGWMEYEHQHRHERSLIIKGSTNDILDIAGCNKEKFAQGPFLVLNLKLKD